MKVKGKEQICVCEDYKKYFKSIQGFGGHTLFDRYNDLENIVNKHVDEKFRHFLAQPELDGNNIYWFSTPYYEEPKRLSDLNEQEQDPYENEKNKTLSHYHKVIEELKSQNKNSESEVLGNALKFVNDDFVYCYDGKTVLGVWGMELRDEVREPLGIAMKNSFEKPKKKKLPVSESNNSDDDPNEEPDITPEDDNDDSLKNVRFESEENGALQGQTDYKMRRGEKVSADMIPDVEAKEGYEFVGWDIEPNNHEVENDVVFTAKFKKKSYKVRFFDGGHGSLQGQTEYDKNYEEHVHAEEVPKVEPVEGYRFVGWDKKPIDYMVRDDTDFVAQYEEVKESWWSRFWGWGSGCLNWLLTLLLLGLIGLLLWYLLGHHNFNFCGCDCNQTTVVVPPSPTPPSPTPIDPDLDSLPVPILKPCNELQREGSNQPESFVFDMGQNTGTFLFEYATGGKFSDRIVIYDGEDRNGKEIFSYHDVTGDNGWSDRETRTLQFNNQRVLIDIIPDESSETYWQIKVNCPQN